MKSLQLSIKLQLAISAAVVIIAAFVYGYDPAMLLPRIFGFEVLEIDLKNIFRAIMGLYLSFALFWIYSLVKNKYIFTALLVNILFMGGLAFGRLLSLILDGVSNQFFIGMILEFLMLFWGVINVRNYNSEIS